MTNAPLVAPQNRRRHDHRPRQKRKTVPRRPGPNPLGNDPTSPKAIGERLRITRQALGHTTTQMCRLMGSPSGGSAFTNYEMGRRRINLDHAFELCRNCSLTLEWIYRGEARNLPEHLQQKIRELRAPRARA